MTELDTGKTQRVRVMNDNFRCTFLGGTVVLTQGVAGLPLDVKAEALLKVKAFKDFTRDNDPYGQHDFGCFEVAGDTFYWKIDYYGPDCQSGSEDPSDPVKTTRVLTIMLAGEY
jgi:uncharacterized protein DUF3768